MTREGLRQWVADAEPGERLSYCCSATPMAGRIKAAARELYREGKVHLLQRRLGVKGDGRFLYLAIRRPA